jgi:LacI family transcriptional regulator
MAENLNIRKIAELAGCSASTVSRVLSQKKTSIKISEKTREKIYSVCRKLDYHPSIHASRLFSNISKVIGFLTPDWISLEDDNLARSMSAAYTHLTNAGYRMLPLSYNDTFFEQQEHLNLFKRREVDALIIWGIHDRTDWLDELAAANNPFILLTNRCKDFPAVTCDNYSGTRQLTEHCLANNAKKFLFITAAEGDCSLEREKAFFDVLTGKDAQIIKGGMTVEAGLSAVKHILNIRPNAIICGNDRLAIGVEQGLEQAGIRIPRDMMVAGADNIELSKYCRVPLTTFDQMAHECAAKAVKILLERLNDKKPLHSALIAPEIIIRESA